MVKLQHIHIANRNWIWEWLTSAPVKQASFAVCIDHDVTVAVWKRIRKQTEELIGEQTVKHWRCHVLLPVSLYGVFWETSCPFFTIFTSLSSIPALGSDPAKVKLEYLPEVHTAWHTKRIQNDIHRSAVFHEWHIFERQNTGDNAFVAVTTSHLIADCDLAALSNMHAHSLAYVGC
ncbi:Uncharacterised protein [Chlamydia trachomatis]|nr:Uncharacterised protein [Chlamydia trachomatis]